MKLKRILLIILSVSVLAILIFEIQRQWSGFPNVDLKDKKGDDQNKLLKGMDIAHYLGHWSFFAYFTVWSNILVVIPFAIINIFNIKIKHYLKFIPLTYMTVTFGVFWTALAPYMPWGQDSYFDFINSYEHIFPFVVALLWAFLPTTKDKVKYSFKELLIFPIIYLIFVFIFTAVVKGKVSMYPFINFTDWFGTGIGTAGSTILALISIIGAGALIIGLYIGLIKLYVRIHKIKAKK